MPKTAYRTVMTGSESNLPLSFGGFWFNENAYTDRRYEGQSHNFFLIDENQSVIVARFHAVPEGKSTVSSPYAPFGSFEFDKHLPFPELEKFINTCCSLLKDHGFSKLKIKSYPTCYDPQNAVILTSILSKNKFKIVQTDINNHIPITDKPFREIIHHSERTNLDRCAEQDFQFTDELNPDFDEVYSMIVENRVKKGYPVTLKKEELISLFDNYGDRYKLFSLKNGNRRVALSVSVRVSDQILYNFYHADDPEHRKISPMRALIGEIYAYSFQNNITLLDLGISSDKSVINQGLHLFKTHSGALSSLKLTFEKEL